MRLLGGESKDLGTGAGNIAISLAKNLNPEKKVKIIATDISKKALKIAKENAKFHGVSDQITFLKSDLLNNITMIKKVIARSKHRPKQSQNRDRNIAYAPRDDTKIDIIVTNLPYIPTARIPYLDFSVKDYEPLIALDGEEDGFSLYRKLFQQIKKNNLSPKLIVCEIDYNHAEIVMEEAQKLVVSEVEPYFPKTYVEIKTDLAHKQRILIIKN